MPRYKPFDVASKRTILRHFASTSSDNSFNENINQTSSATTLPALAPIELLPPEPVIENIDSDEESIKGIDSDEECVLSDLSDNEFDVNEHEKYIAFLTEWKFSNNVSNTALNELLCFLKSNGHSYLPKDSRTLLGTPKTRTIYDVPPGKYVHIGLRNSLQPILSNYWKENENPFSLNEIILDINIDGIPISRSSTSSFWLILFKIHNLPKSKVATIGIYHGYSKPNSFSDFIRPHVDELKELLHHFSYEGHTIKLKIRAYICDAPARALLTGTKSHTAYFGCGKCSQEGLFLKSRMTFPETEVTLRTNESFRQKLDSYYHKYTSPIEELDIDMVNQVPLDYLHTVLLGVVKKLIRMWISGDLLYRLPSSAINQISERLLVVASSQPDEFQRKVRSLADFGYFKGSELRTFLLYAGPVALKNIISNEKYCHFLILHSAITILCDKLKCVSDSNLHLAKQLLTSFIINMGEIYGEEHLIYNVHSLLHLVDDVRRFGCLDDYSAFTFESYNFQVKRLLHKNCQPLPEISNRITEMNSAEYLKKKAYPIYPLLKKEGITKDGIYNEIQFEHSTLNTKFKNQWFITKNLKIVKFLNAKMIGEDVVLFGHQIKRKYDFFMVPIRSSFLNIYASCGEIEDDVCQYKVDDIMSKLFCISNTCENNVVFFPLLHSINVFDRE